MNRLSSRSQNMQANLSSNLPPLRFVRGKGAICWDNEGRRHVDYICGYGPIILGHADDRVNRAVCEQLEKGLLFSADSDLIDALHRELKSRFPDTAVMRCLKTGSEAVAAALRLARAHTGRMKIIRCGFHGWHDQMVAPFRDWHIAEADANEADPVAGLPPDAGHVLLWDGADLNQLEGMLRQDRGAVAAMILDPVQLRSPMDENLWAIRELTRRHDALLILDELKTGFRVGPAGVQGCYGVRADLTILGKAIANGFPLSVVLAPEWAAPLGRKARLKGTFNSELGSIAAALATLDALKQSAAFEQLALIGHRLIDGLNGVFDRVGLGGSIEAIPYRWPCMPYIWFRAKDDRMRGLKAAFYTRMAARGHLLLADHMNFVMLAHRAEDIDQTIDAAAQTLSELSGRRQA
jgi:glutamate-1-semialdehyde 2,1-aminomutase